MGACSVELESASETDQSLIYYYDHMIRVCPPVLLVLQLQSFASLAPRVLRNVITGKRQRFVCERLGRMTSTDSQNRLRVWAQGQPSLCPFGSVWWLEVLGCLPLWTWTVRPDPKDGASQTREVQGRFEHFQKGSIGL